MLALVDMTNEDVNARLDRLETLMKSEGETTRRHFDVVAEGLRQEIHVIAEGHGVLRGDVADLKAGQARVEEGQERLEIRQSALEYRQTRLEDQTKELTTEVRLLIARTG